MLFIVNGSWYVPISNPGKYEEYIKFAIQDFIKKSPLSKKDTVFHVLVKEHGNEIVGVHICGSTRKPLVVRDGDSIRVSSLPSRVIEMNGKLFFWYDKEISVTTEVITELKKYNYIDTAILNIYVPPYIIDDAKKCENYYFCKNNMQKFKRIQTNKWHQIPELNCK